MLAEYGDRVAEYDEIDRARLLLAYTRRQRFNARLIVGQLAEALSGGGASTGSATGGYRQVDAETMLGMMGMRLD